MIFSLPEIPLPENSWNRKYRKEASASGHTEAGNIYGDELETEQSERETTGTGKSLPVFLFCFFSSKHIKSGSL